MRKLWPLVLSATACASSVEVTPAAFEKQSGAGRPIVFVPGIKGSALADASGEQVFLTRGQVVGLSTPNLALPVTIRDGRQEADGIHANGILRELYVIPALMGEQIYGPWLDALKATGRPIYLFAYDWRRDNMETLRALQRTVSQVAETHGQPVDVIGHSMGGMLAYALLTAEADNDDALEPPHVGSLVLAGSPLRGGVGFLPDLHDGTSAGLNGDLLAPHVLATFPSIFSFFPMNAGADMDPPIDFFDAKGWQSAKLGPYAEGRTRPDGFDAYFVDALARAAMFRMRVVAAPVREVPITVVASRATPTIARAIRVGGTVDFEQDKAPGDGRVPFERALPAAPHTVIETKNEHSTLLNDPDVIRAILPN